MKIIFLDIDGVLNHEMFYCGLCTHSRHEEYPISEIDRGSVEQLNVLIKATNAKVVLTTTWRKSYSIFNIQSYLNEQGFIGEIIGVTPHIENAYTLRGNEIFAWIKEHEKAIGKAYYDYTQYVILDDDSDMLYWQRNNFILVDSYCGLSPRNVLHATRILNNGISEV